MSEQVDYCKAAVTGIFTCVLLSTGCSNPENAAKKIDMDSLKGQLPTAPITPPDTSRQFDTTQAPINQ